MFGTMCFSAVCLAVCLAALTAVFEPTTPFLQAREGFKTTLNEAATAGDGVEATTPPSSQPFALIKYTSPAGPLAAYLTPDPKDGKKHPAMIVCTGGFGGIGSSSWTVERYTGHFRKAGMIVMCPSWRGQQANPGKYECFFGEVDDALAAIEHVRSLPYVDPSRVYITGHSTGGTMAMLAALATDKIRASFPLGGNPDFVAEAAEGTAYGMPPPFDIKNAEETKLRSFKSFVSTLKVPTFYFEGQFSPYPRVMEPIGAEAAKAGVPLGVFTIENGDHFAIVDCINGLIAAKVKADTGEKVSISVSAEEVRAAFKNRRPPFEAKADRSKGPAILLTPAAIKAIQGFMEEKKYDPAKMGVRVGMNPYFEQFVTFEEEGRDGDMAFKISGLTVYMDPMSILLMHGTKVDYSKESGFDYENPNEN